MNTLSLTFSGLKKDYPGGRGNSRDILQAHFKIPLRDIDITTVAEATVKAVAIGLFKDTEVDKQFALEDKLAQATAFLRINCSVNCVKLSTDPAWSTLVTPGSFYAFMDSQFIDESYATKLDIFRFFSSMTFHDVEKNYISLNTKLFSLGKDAGSLSWEELFIGQTLVNLDPSWNSFVEKYATKKDWGSMTKFVDEFNKEKEIKGIFGMNPPPQKGYSSCKCSQINPWSYWYQALQRQFLVETWNT